jgi:multidrug resistance protein MdtO
LGQFVREPRPGDTTYEGKRSRSLREGINAKFDKVWGLADAVLFEFGASRHEDLALRDRIRRWQPQLRTLFVTRIALLKYRLQIPGFELPEPVHAAQQEFDDRLAGMLDGMADRMEGKPPERNGNLDSSFERLEETVQTCCAEEPEKSLTAEMQTFLALSRSIDSVAVSLDREI